MREVPGLGSGSWMVAPEYAPEVTQPVLSILLDALSRGSVLIKLSSFLCMACQSHRAGGGLPPFGELDAKKVKAALDTANEGFIRMLLQA